MRTLNNPLSLTGTAIAVSLLLSACSEGGSVTTLDARPSVSIDLPQVLLDATFINSDNISPTILLSNGASVTMQKGEGNAWSGTINVAPATQYTATVMWAETFNGQELPLAILQQTIEVAADGTVVTTQSTDYTTDIDTDNDGVSNLQERDNDTDPFNAPVVESPNEPANDEAGEQPTDTSQDPTTGPAQSPTVIPTQVPAEQPSTPSDPTTTPSVPDTTPEPPAVTPTPEATPSTTPEPTTVTPAPEPAPSTTPEPPTTTPAPEPDPSTTPEAPVTEPLATPVAEAPSTEPTPEPDSAPTTPQVDELPSDPADVTPEPVAVIADTVVPRIAKSDAPTIDGNDVAIDSNGQLIGEWAAAVQLDSSGAPLLIDNLIIDINAESPDGTPYRRWAALHDGDYLYVVVIVDDNGDRQRDSLSNLTDDDSLELFLDGDNSKSSSYGNDDFHRIFPVRLPGVDKRSADKGDIAGPNSSTAGLSVTFATGPGVGPRGIRRARYEQDVYELKIKLSSAGIDTDAAFGFELQVNDDDGGDTRDSKWAWKHPSRVGTDVDATVDDPSTMGTLKLE